MAEGKSLFHQRWEAAIEEGDLKQASKYYVMMVDSGAIIPKIHYTMGLWYRQNNQNKEGWAAFQLAMAQGYEDLAEGYFQLAGILEDEGQPIEAQKFYRKAIEGRPDFIEAIFSLGQLFASQGKIKESIQCLHQALALDCRSGEIYINVAVELSYMGLKDEAIDVYFQALIIEPDNYFLYSNLGTEFAELGDFDSAVFCHTKAIKYNSFVSDLWYNLACTYSLMEEGEKGLKALEKAFNLDPDNRDYAEVDEELAFLRTQAKYWKIISSF